MRKRWRVALGFCLSLGLMAGDLALDVQAKFIKVIIGNANSAGKIACKDAAVAGELQKIGVAHDPGAKVAWAASEGDVTALKGSGKLVICGKLDWLPKGASIAIIEEAGKPQIYLHMGNLAASGVTLTDAILKIGKKL